MEDKSNSKTICPNCDRVLESSKDNTGGINTRLCAECVYGIYSQQEGYAEFLLDEIKKELQRKDNWIGERNYERPRGLEQKKIKTVVTPEIRKEYDRFRLALEKSIKSEQSEHQIGENRK